MGGRGASQAENVRSKAKTPLVCLGTAKHACVADRHSKGTTCRPTTLTGSRNIAFKGPPVDTFFSKSSYVV